MRIAATAAAAATLVWSMLFYDALAQHRSATTAAPASAAHAGQPGQALAPVTTRTS